MPYTHPMPVVAFCSAVIADNLFVFTAGGEGIIRAWQFNKAANTFAQVSMFEGHTRGITALLFIGWSGLFACAMCLRILMPRLFLQEETCGQAPWTARCAAGP